MATISEHNAARHNGIFAKADYIVGIVVDGAFYCASCVGSKDADATDPVFVTDDYSDLTCDDCMRMV